jgi:hypothetical protein
MLRTISAVVLTVAWYTNVNFITVAVIQLGALAAPAPAPLPSGESLDWEAMTGALESRIYAQKARNQKCGECMAKKLLQVR